MSADVISGLIAWLKADAGVAALAGTRVFGLELPGTEAASMPRHAVVIKASGGLSITAGSYAEHASQRVDAFCHGATPYQAESLRRAVDDALKPLRRAVSSGCLIHWVEPAGGFATLRDPDGHWPVAFQSFQVFFAEAAAA